MKGFLSMHVTLPILWLLSRGGPLTIHIGIAIALALTPSVDYTYL